MDDLAITAAIETIVSGAYDIFESRFGRGAALCALVPWSGLVCWAGLVFPY
jgi:hypothetical protein